MTANKEPAVGLQQMVGVPLPTAQVNDISTAAHPLHLLTGKVKGAAISAAPEHPDL